MLDFTFHMPTRIIFGAGRLAELGRTRLPGRKALVVISAGGSMRRTGHLDKVLALLAQSGCTTVLFEKIQPNTVLTHVDEGAALARTEGCDFVLGLGGAAPSIPPNPSPWPPPTPARTGTTSRAAPAGASGQSARPCRWWPFPPRRAPVPRPTRGR